MTTDPALRVAILRTARILVRAWWTRLCLRMALGRRTAGYLRRSVLTDPRTPSARLVDIVVRKDGCEVRIEADWVKDIARAYRPKPAHRYRRGMAPVLPPACGALENERTQEQAP